MQIDVGDVGVERERAGGGARARGDVQAGERHADGVRDHDIGGLSADAFVVGGEVGQEGA